MEGNQQFFNSAIVGALQKNCPELTELVNWAFEGRLVLGSQYTVKPRDAVIRDKSRAVRVESDFWLDDAVVITGTKHENGVVNLEIEAGTLGPDDMWRMFLYSLEVGRAENVSLDPRNVLLPFQCVVVLHKNSSGDSRVREVISAHDVEGLSKVRYSVNVHYLDRGSFDTVLRPLLVAEELYGSLPYDELDGAAHEIEERFGNPSDGKHYFDQMSAGLKQRFKERSYVMNQPAIAQRGISPEVVDWHKEYQRKEAQKKEAARQEGIQQGVQQGAAKADHDAAMRMLQMGTPFKFVQQVYPNLQQVLSEKEFEMYYNISGGDAEGDGGTVEFLDYYRK